VDLASDWPNVSNDDPFAKHLNSTPKYVASRTLQDVEWAGRPSSRAMSPSR